MCRFAHLILIEELFALKHGAGENWGRIFGENIGQKMGEKKFTIESAKFKNLNFSYFKFMKYQVVLNLLSHVTLALVENPEGPTLRPNHFLVAFFTLKNRELMLALYTRAL